MQLLFLEDTAHVLLRLCDDSDGRVRQGDSDV